MASLLEAFPAKSPQFQEVIDQLLPGAGRRPPLELTGGSVGTLVTSTLPAFQVCCLLPILTFTCHLRLVSPVACAPPGAGYSRGPGMTLVMNALCKEG